MNNKLVLFSVVGLLLFFICRELQKQNIVILPPTSEPEIQLETKVEHPIFEKIKKKGNDFIFPAITTITQPLTKFVNQLSSKLLSNKKNKKSLSSLALDLIEEGEQINKIINNFNINNTFCCTITKIFF